jgi:dethiobiotin synthetase
LNQQEVIACLRSTCQQFDVVVIEGAGGLLSPLGEEFNSRDLIIALAATPIVVAPNRLGAVNQVLLTLEALPAPQTRRAVIVLSEPSHPSVVTRSNVALLSELLDGRPIHRLPWLGKRSQLDQAEKRPDVRRLLARLIRSMR